MEDISKRPNYFVRTLISIFSLGIALMIGFNFIYVEPIGEITNGIYTLLAILLVLVLAESFDNFSIGKLISIKREVEIKKEENKNLEKKNSELISQIISVTNNHNQKQQSTTVLGDYYSETKTDLQHKKGKNDSVQELLERIGNSIVITDLENSIKQELQLKNLEIEGDTIKVLIRHLAGTQLLLEFERIHSLIFGSQLFMLKQLNKSIPVGISESEIFTHLERVKKLNEPTLDEWNTDEYLNFLLVKLLIVKDESKRIIHITNLGVEYLTWIARNGLSEDKPF